jgi:hypothetical protein
VFQAKFIKCFAAQAKQQTAYAGALHAAQQIIDEVAKP